MSVNNIYTQGDDEVKEDFRQLVKNFLHTGETTVVFEKADGSTRTMKCTLDPALLPVVEETESIDTPKKERKPNPEVQVAFDVEKQEWRSFRYDKIITVGIV